MFTCNTQQHGMYRLALMYFHCSLFGMVRWFGHGERITCSPMESRHRAAMGPHRTSPLEFRSQCCHDKGRPCLTFRIWIFLTFTIKNRCHGYLAACPAAWCYVHGPTLQSQPSGVVRTAASADIVQLQTGRNMTLHNPSWRGGVTYQTRPKTSSLEMAGAIRENA